MKIIVVGSISSGMTLAERLAAGEGAGAPITAIDESLGFEQDYKRDGDRLTRTLR